jgi:hypothetical protein
MRKSSKRRSSPKRGSPSRRSPKRGSPKRKKSKRKSPYRRSLKRGNKKVKMGFTNDEITKFVLKQLKQIFNDSENGAHEYDNHSLFLSGYRSSENPCFICGRADTFYRSVFFGEKEKYLCLIHQVALSSPYMIKFVKKLPYKGLLIDDIFYRENEVDDIIAQKTSEIIGENYKDSFEPSLFTQTMRSYM